MGKVNVYNEDGVELQVKHSTFPAGEVYVKVIDTALVTSHMVVELLSADSEQIMRAIMLADALTILGATDITLYAPYLPYSRQDRACSVGESYSLGVFKDLIEARFDDVITVDIHNPQLVGTLITNIMPDYEVLLSEYPEGTVIVAPDKGAVERCQRASCSRYPVAILGKARLAGGGIKQYPLLPADAELITNAKSLLIVDDICDGGATFINTSHILHEHNTTAELHLFVTHGIFSQGMERLEEVFASVKCVNRYTK